MTLEIPPAFVILDPPHGLEDLGDSVIATVQRENIRLVARRDSSDHEFVDLVIVSDVPGSLEDAVPDLCAPFDSASRTVTDTREVQLPIGTARRCAITSQVRDGVRPRGVEARVWHLEVADTTVSLQIVRYASAGSVPEADEIADTMSRH